MSIIRVVHDKSNPYVIINKESLWDKDLSLAAVGMWARLLSRPDDWRISVKELSISCDITEGAVYRILNELIKFGYVHRQQKKGNEKNKSRFKAVEYWVFERRVSPEEIKKMFPLCTFPHAEFPLSGKSKTTNKDKEPSKDITDIDGAAPVVHNSEDSTSDSFCVAKAPRRTTADSLIFDWDKKRLSGIEEDDLKAWKALAPAIADLGVFLEFVQQKIASQPARYGKRKKIRATVLEFLKREQERLVTSAVRADVPRTRTNFNTVRKLKNENAHLLEHIYTKGDWVLDKRDVNRELSLDIEPETFYKRFLEFAGVEDDGT